jgi:hypothetical protein
MIDKQTYVPAATEENEIIITENHIRDPNFHQSIIAASVHSSQIGFVLKDISIAAFVKSNFYHEYNFFIEQYNNDINRVDDIYLKPLKLSIFTGLPSCGICSCWYFLSVCLFLSIPTFFYNLIRLILIIRCAYEVSKNNQVLKNPFQKMIYCKDLKKFNAYYEISSNQYTQDLFALGVSQENFYALFAQYSSSYSRLGSIGIMFYTEAFANFYNHAPRKICFDIFLTSIFLFLSLIFASLSSSIIITIASG